MSRLKGTVCGPAMDGALAAAFYGLKAMSGTWIDVLRGKDVSEALLDSYGR